MNILERNNKNVQFINTLISFRGNLIIMHDLIYSEKTLAANFLAMAHSDYNSLKGIYYNSLSESEEIEKLFIEYSEYKQEIVDILLSPVKNPLSFLKSFHIDIINKINQVEEKLMK